jgi:hypothetical protein
MNSKKQLRAAIIAARRFHADAMKQLDNGWRELAGDMNASTKAEHPALIEAAGVSLTPLLNIPPGYEPSRQKATSADLEGFDSHRFGGRA